MKVEKPGPSIPSGPTSQLKKPSCVKVMRMAITFTRYPAHNGRVIETASTARSQGEATFAMKMPSGIEIAMASAVTPRAIARVRTEVVRYAGLVISCSKLRRVKPDFTLEVNGSVTQNAVTSNKTSEKM